MKIMFVFISLCLLLVFSACSVTTISTTASTLAPTSVTSTASTSTTVSTGALQTPTPDITTTTSLVIPTTSETTASEAVTSGTAVLTGTFLSAEWGDYLHIDIRGDDNVEYSFYVLKYPGIDVEDLEAGQRVKVIWKNTDEFLDPPGETVNIDLIISIELLD